MNIITEAHCANCNARPSALGYSYCSKACGTAAKQRNNTAHFPSAPSNASGVAGFIPTAASKAMGAIANRSSSGQSTRNNNYGGSGSMNGYNSSGIWASGVSPRSPPANTKQGSWTSWLPGSSNSGKCIIPGCQKPGWPDKSGKVTKYCSKAHMNIGNASSGACAIPGCGKQAYTDPQTGHMSQFCSLGHMKQGLGNSVGASNSQVVYSNSLPMIHSGGQHAPAAYAPITLVINTQPSPQTPRCHLDGCNKDVWINPSNGQPSQYCTKTHRNLGRTHNARHPAGHLQPQHNVSASKPHWQPPQHHTSEVPNGHWKA